MNDRDIIELQHKCQQLEEENMYLVKRVDDLEDLIEKVIHPVKLKGVAIED